MQINAGTLGVLLRKDVRMQWIAVLVLLVVELITVVSLVAQFPPQMQQSAGIFVQGVASIGTFVMAYRAVATEESAGVMGFLKSLPLTNDEIFGSRFLFLGGYVVVNAVLLNAGYAAIRPVLGWADANPSWGVMIAGVVVQLLFAVLLVGVAVLVNSEKAIWVPFPLVIVLLNAYTLMTSQPDSWGSHLVEHVRGAWPLYSIGVVVLLVIASYLVLRIVRTKKTLVR